ncbi:helix-turn-helix transcriptional regulator [Yeosuana marina]|uniref:helix-turn-helix domain-containing protein n=1 Tax=Yeosuana marina TaxID=1565536 RepID=UPI0030C7B02B
MNTIQETFSDNLKAIRKEKGLSQNDVAEKSGMIASTYNRIENMKVSPSIDTIERIAKAMDTPFVELFLSREIKDRSLLDKLEVINSLSDYNRNVVEIMLNTIIEKDKLEKTKEFKIQKRLEELNKVKDIN